MMKSIPKLCHLSVQVILCFFCWHMGMNALKAQSLRCDKPTGLSVSNLTDSSATLQWEAGENMDEFEVQIRSAGRAADLAESMSTVSTKWVVDFLEPGQKYKFRVRAKCGEQSMSGHTKWQTFETVGVTTFSHCTKAENLKATNLGSESVLLEWSAPSDGMHFEVEVQSRDKTNSFFLEKSLADSSTLVTGLLPEGKYKFRVRTTCVNGAVSGATRWFKFEQLDTTNMDTCDHLTNVILQNITHESATLFWSTLDNAKAYLVTLIDSTEEEQLFENPTSPFQLLNLEADMAYVVHLSAFCAEGEPKTMAIWFRTLAAPDSCTQPLHLNVSVDSTHFVLSWDTVPSAEAYHLQIAHQDTSPVYVDTIVDTRVYLFDQLDSIEGYSFRVQSLCAGGVVSDFTAWALFGGSDSTGRSLCESPSDLHVESASADGTVLRWSAIDASVFELELKNADTAWSMMVSLDDDKNQLLLEDLDTLLEHEVRIRSRCNNEVSEYTEWLAFMPLESSLCDTPDSLDSEIKAPKTATLKWEDVGAKEYLITVEPMDSSAALQLRSSHSMIEVSGLTKGANYRFRVSAICEAGDTSAYSSWYRFGVSDLPLECDKADSLIVDSLGDDFATISWMGDSTSYYSVIIQYQDTVAHEWRSFTSDHFVRFDSLMPATEYHVYVETICDSTLMAMSDTLAFTTLDSNAVVCLIPENVMLDSVDTHRAWMSWSGKGLFFQVEISRRYTMDDPVIFTSDETLIMISGLEPNEDYIARVKTICEDSTSSGWSDLFEFQTLQVEEDSCSVPMGQVDSIGRESAWVSWSSSQQGSFYLIEIENVGYTPSFHLLTTVRRAKYRFEGLVPGGQYQWKVATFCPSGEYGDCSPWMDVETLSDEIVCDAPAGLTVQRVRSQVVLTWDSVPGSIDYELEIESTNGTGAYSQSEIVVRSQYDAADIPEVGTFQFKVNVQCKDGTISEDSEWHVFELPLTTGQGPASARRASMIYPNPVKSKVHILVPDGFVAERAEIRITDLLGIPILTTQVEQISSGDRLSLTIPNMREGVYRISMNSSDQRVYDLIYKLE